VWKRLKVLRNKRASKDQLGNRETRHPWESKAPRCENEKRRKGGNADEESAQRLELSATTPPNRTPRVGKERTDLNGEENSVLISKLSSGHHKKDWGPAVEDTRVAEKRSGGKSLLEGRELNERRKISEYDNPIQLVHSRASISKGQG